MNGLTRSEQKNLKDVERQSFSHPDPRNSPGYSRRSCTATGAGTSPPSGPAGAIGR